LGANPPAKVKVDAEEALLYLTDQSVMFEKGGGISGFERNAIRMVKPDGDAMIIAYSAGSEVKSVRVEPMTAVAALLMPMSGTGPTPRDSRMTASASVLEDVFERLYREARSDLEARLTRVEEEPQNKSLRLTPEEQQRYIAIRNQMTNLAGGKYGTDRDAEEPLLTFWGLENRPYELQVSVVKILHINFLLGIVGPRAETEDVGYQAYHVWPDDWPRILGRFNLGDAPYTTEKFADYVGYLKSHWKYSPSAKRPVLVGM